jgi:hypothetical protein
MNAWMCGTKYFPLEANSFESLRSKFVTYIGGGAVEPCQLLVMSLYNLLVLKTNSLFYQISVQDTHPD